MDISFEAGEEKFNYRVGAVILNDGKLLAMRDEDAPYYYLPGGRVKLGETAEQAVIREVYEELHVTAEIVRPLWLNQAFFKEEVDGLRSTSCASAFCWMSQIPSCPPAATGSA